MEDEIQTLLDDIDTLTTDMQKYYYAYQTCMYLRILVQLIALQLGYIWYKKYKKSTKHIQYAKKETSKTNITSLSGHDYLLIIYISYLFGR